MCLALCAAALLAACGGGGTAGARPDVPAVVRFESGSHVLEVGTAPLSLRLSREGVTLTEAVDPLRVGVVDARPGEYVDPEAPPPETEWRAVGDVVAVRGGTLELADGSTLQIETPAWSSIDGGFRLTFRPAGAAPALTRVALAAAARERFFGFGEVWDTASTRGQVRPMQMRLHPASESGLNEIHVPVPLAISPRGWALLARTMHPGAFDVGAEREDRISATFLSAPSLELFLLGDADPLALVEGHVEITGRPALPPAWAFAPMQWRNQVTGSEMVLDDARTMRKLGVPGSTIWIDNPWQTHYNSFAFSERFPDPAGLIAELGALGYRVLVWSTPYLAREDPDWRGALDAGWFVRLGDAPMPGVSGFGNPIDFSAPGAVEFWRERARRAIDLGVSGFKLDYGEDLVPELGGGVPDLRLASGETALTAGRSYPARYHEAYLGALPEGDGVLVTRSGALGGQTVNPIVWPCDLDSDLSRHEHGNIGGLPAAVAAALSLSCSGYPFFGSDIGGFREGRPDKETLLRWAAFAALGTIMQLGGGGESHNPWDFSAYDPETLEVYTRYARLHTDLFPYLYTHAARASRTGRPVTAPLGLAFPADEAAWGEDFSYLLGDALLVAPVIDRGGTREVYLPEGEWIDWFTREARQGPARFSLDVPLDRIPLYARAGAIVPLLAVPVDTLAEASDPSVVSYRDRGDALRVLVFPGPAPASFTLFDGTRIEADPGGREARATPGDRFRSIEIEVVKVAR